ncbi:MAG: DNA-directed RNA polymerase subunit omega [Nitrososphaerales archaeon]
MARITVEDCLKKVPNEYELALLAAMRTHQLHRGARPLVKSSNREVILALREIAAGKVRKSSKELKPLKKKADTQARVKSRDH